MYCVIHILQNIDYSNLQQLNSLSCSTEKDLFLPFAKVSLAVHVVVGALSDCCSLAVDMDHISVSWIQFVELDLARRQCHEQSVFFYNPLMTNV